MSNEIQYIGGRFPITVEWLDYANRGYPTGFNAFDTIVFEVFSPITRTKSTLTAAATSAALATANSGASTIDEAGRWEVQALGTATNIIQRLDPQYFDVREIPE
jgi:hypothetical protein